MKTKQRNAKIPNKNPLLFYLKYIYAIGSVTFLKAEKTKYENFNYVHLFFLFLAHA